MEVDWPLQRQQQEGQNNQTIFPFLLPLHHHHRSLYLPEGIIQHNNHNNILDHGLIITEMTPPISAATATITILLLYDPKQQRDFIA